MKISLSRVNKIVWKFLYGIGNLKLSIVLLLFISMVLALGTVLEQDRQVSFYKLVYSNAKPFLGFLSSDFILFFGLDHVYKTTWFFLLVSFFCITLISCTLVRQVPSLKLAKIWKFFKGELYSHSIGTRLLISESNLSRLSYLLREKSYNVVQKGCYLYAYKGVIGKIAPIVVHLSIIFILIGSSCSQMMGFMSQEMVQTGDLFYPQNIISFGEFSKVRMDFVSYVKDFRIAYTDWGLIDQFYSELQIWDSNLNFVLDKIIFVNEPLRYRGATFYQTDWDIPILSMQDINENIFSLRIKEVNLENGGRFWVGFCKNQKGKDLIVILEDLTGRYFVYNLEKEFIAMQKVGSKIFIDGLEIRVSNIFPSTGIQVKLDPGIIFIYFGFLTLVLSIGLSYLSYSQIWVMKKKDILYIYGNTNRGMYLFKRSLIKLIREI